MSGVRTGVVFVPFHYGYWDRVTESNGPDLGAAEHDRAANELTITSWDAVSKQPIFKTAAARVSRVAHGGDAAAPAPDIGGSARTAASATGESD